MMTLRTLFAVCLVLQISLPAIRQVHCTKNVSFDTRSITENYRNNSPIQHSIRLVDSNSFKTDLVNENEKRAADTVDAARHKHHWKKKINKTLKRLTLPLLLAYKLKFFILIPVLIGGLILLTGTTGLAGFFFACFAAALALRNQHS